MADDFEDDEEALTCFSDAGTLFPDVEWRGAVAGGVKATGIGTAGGVFCGGLL
jgi:hypothetical protein